MSSSNSSIAEIESIRYSKNMFMQFWSYMLIILGTIGHPLSIYVFTRPTLRSNPCVRYFLAATISGIFVTYINTPLRLIQSVYSIDIFGYSTVSCKIVTYLVNYTRTQTPWFIALSSIDRFLCSSRSATLRAWSSVRASSYIILIMMLIGALAHIYVLIQYQIQPRGPRCPGSQSNPPIFHGIWTFIIFSFGPSIIMLVFGSLTIRHVQQATKRAGFNNIITQTQSVSAQDHLQRQKTTDRQLIQMMIVQCVYFCVMATPISVNFIYFAVRTNVLSDALQNAKDDLFTQIAGNISITSACTIFYVFTMSSQLFRRELMHFSHG